MVNGLQRVRPGSQVQPESVPMADAETLATLDRQRRAISEAMKPQVVERTSLSAQAAEYLRPELRRACAQIRSIRQGRDARPTPECAMNFSQFFIKRPIFAAVLSLVILIGGAISLFQLPISEYPKSSAHRGGAGQLPRRQPKVIGETVASPLEQAITGVEGMLYMSSQATADGKLTLTITFALGTDRTTPRCRCRTGDAHHADPAHRGAAPGRDRGQGLPDLTMVVHLTSPDNRYDMLYLSNYAALNVRTSWRDWTVWATCSCSACYSLRVWLDPNKVAQRNLTATDVVNAIREQNRQVAAGALGAPPAPGATDFQLSINTQGRLVDEEEFENIIVRAGETARSPA